MVLPFQDLAGLREEEIVTGISIDEIPGKVEGAEKDGRDPLTLEEQEGKFMVTGVTVE